MGSLPQITWTVIGAGPAGLCAIGNLLSSGIREDQVVWIDPHFNSGNLSDVPEVPSNTKVQLFLKFFTACPYLNERAKEIESGSPNDNPFKSMRDLEQEIGCPLSYAAAAVTATTQCILNRIKNRKAMVTSVEKSDKQNEWTITLEDGEKLQTERIVFCTGSKARELNIHRDYPNIQCIPLQDGFSATKLKSIINEKDHVAVLGTSHSGVLLLRNLCTILPEEHGLKVASVECVSRKPLLYAEYMDGWIKNDNTGLKLAAADWAREYYDKSCHPLLRKITLSQDEQKTYKELLPNCTKIVYAVGYDRVKLPQIIYNGVESNVTHDGKCGKLKDENGKEIDGLYGLGIAFPELRKYPNGVEEWAVGMWKFMDYGMRVIPSWS
ncbi:hypothetical protein PROFUN_02845 [Planoprotostelium fungivorum]|uniref:Uncharacterized protein n=1 Tax=Planoprotostelium fungivorum TaxID=1890364 RepID=A0A2P6NRW6_9EUKA|nr:hypothetical protein PROFUN_02845 [Planoprotostelium fungivorum]